MRSSGGAPEKWAGSSLSAMVILDVLYHLLIPAVEFFDGALCVYGADETSVLHPDYRSGAWPHRTPAKNKALRHVPILAQFLKPILGKQADREAERLIKRFGCIANILDASPAALQAALHDRPEIANALIAARKLAVVGWSENLIGQTVDPEDARLAAYLVSQLQNPREERLQAIYFDRNRRFICDERVCAGQGHKLTLHTRKLIHRALELNAFGLIIAHNHPSGSTVPSKSDREATARLRTITAAVGIDLIDHFIIARGTAFSMRLENTL